MSRVKRLVVVLGMVVGLSAGAFAGLQEYVDKPDDSYAYEIDSTTQVNGNTLVVVRLTSQNWQDTVWQHWLTLVVPSEIKHPEKAMLLISGGNSRSGPPSLEGSIEARVLNTVAKRTGTVAAVLNQVPNQPLFEGLSEDGLISYTYEKYYTTGDDEWPLLLPMTKSVVRAMDAVQAVAKQNHDIDIKAFVVGGGSKRGWTTWLTGASDPRVVAIVPAVIDVLNMAPQMQHQLKTYGAFSRMINDYTERGIQKLITSPEGQKLLKVVDPYSYIDKVTMPKLLLLGTNDPYWCVDSANLYFPDLKGEKHLRYEPNGGHGLGPGVYSPILSFYTSVLTGEKIPEYGWKRLDDGALEVTWDCPGTKAVLWQANSPNRDFRKSLWSSSPLEGDDGCVAKVDAPAEGWTAYYVEVVFPGLAGGAPYGLCTQMTVLPDTFPAHEQTTATTQ